MSFLLHKSLLGLILGGYIYRYTPVATPLIVYRNQITPGDLFGPYRIVNVTYLLLCPIMGLVVLLAVFVQSLQP